MAVWGPGPFDNDAATRWAGRFDVADREARLDLVRDALRAVLDGDGTADEGEAVAAAPVVAAVVPGGLSFDPTDGPVPITADALDVDDDLRRLALEALRRVSSQGSPWYRQWADAGRLDEASSSLQPVVAALRG